jgi:hypothetical protein
MKKISLQATKSPILHFCGKRSSMYYSNCGYRDEKDGPWIAVTMRVWAPWTAVFGMRDPGHSGHHEGVRGHA